MNKDLIKVLVVEDDPGHLALVRGYLEESLAPACEIVHAGSLAAALQTLQKETFDIVLLDLGLPDSSGLAGLEKILAAHPLLPVVALTSQSDENLGVEALQKGAADHLEKFHLNRHNLRHSLRYAIERLRSETERKRLYALLETERANLQKIFDGNSIGMLLLDGSGGVTRMNKTVAGWTGRTQETVRGLQPGNALGCVNVFGGSDVCGRTEACKGCPIRKAFEDALRSGDPVRGVEVLANLQLEGKRAGLWLEVNASPLFIEGKKHVILTLNDITARKRTEASLKKSEERLAAVYQSMSDGLALHQVVYDESGKAVDYLVNEVNPAFESITGIKRSGAIGKKASELYGAQEAPYLDVYSRVAETGEPCSFETYFPPLDKNFNISVFSPRKGEFATVFQDITDRAKAEEEREHLLAELKLRALELDSIVGAMPFLVSLHGPDGKYVRVNQALVNLFGLDPTKAKREDIARRLKARHLDGRPFTLENMPSTNTLKGEAVSNFEYLITDAQGADHTLQMNAIPLKVGEHVYGAVFAQVDITERKKGEAELQKITRVLKAASDSNLAMLHSDSEQEYMDKICRLIQEDCGYPFVWIGFAEQDEEKTVRPAAQAGFDDGYIAAMKISWGDNERGRGPTGTAIRAGKPDGCRDMRTDPAFAPWREAALKRGFASSLVLPLMSGGQAFGAMTIYSRKTDAFSEEEAKLLGGLADDLVYGLRSLRLSAAHKLSAQDMQRIANIGAWELDLTTNTATWSEEIYRIFELDPERVPASFETFMEMVHPEDRAAADRGYADSVKNRAPFDIACRLQLKDGRVKYVHTHCVTSYDAGGAPLRSSGIVHNVTRLKESESGLAAIRAELERAKRLSDIGVLAATVAHELRNPLATIGMAAVNIKRKADNPNLAKHLENIAKKVSESNQIINNLLFYSRLKPPHYERVGLHPLLEEVAEEAEENYKKDMVIARKFSGLKGVAAEMDAVQIREVLNNLMNNAVDSLPDRGGKVELSGEVNRGFVHLAVKDTGSGIDKENLPHIFDPFFSTKAKGTGLGLPVCRQIVDFHGGSITVCSDPGKGTIVKVSLPLERAAKA